MLRKKELWAQEQKSRIGADANQTARSGRIAFERAV
jgi:hypothetical protein